MSRIGNKIITIPEGLNVTISEGLVDIKGKFGEDKIPFNKDFISVEIKDNILTVKRANDEKAVKEIVLTANVEFGSIGDAYYIYKK